MVKITQDPEVMSGAPCFEGTRLPVAHIAGMLKRGASEAELLADYPDLSPAHLDAARMFDPGACPELTPTGRHLRLR